MELRGSLHGVLEHHQSRAGRPRRYTCAAQFLACAKKQAWGCASSTQGHKLPRSRNGSWVRPKPACGIPNCHCLAMGGRRPGRPHHLEQLPRPATLALPAGTGASALTTGNVVGVLPLLQGLSQPKSFSKKHAGPTTGPPASLELSVGEGANYIQGRARRRAVLERFTQADRSIQ